jgi:AcrR family transcriptional regulator
VSQSAFADRVDPRPARRQRRLDEIIAAAWAIADEEGLAGLSLREVARRVGLRQPSLYSYFDSKMALYDVMFGTAAADLLTHIREAPLAEDAREAVRDSCHALAAFTQQNPSAAQLLFTRTIPGFEPSAASYALAEEFFAEIVERLRAAGVTDPGDIDIFTAVVGGLIQQQDTNDPGGDRYIRHLDVLLGMFFSYIEARRA